MSKSSLFIGEQDKKCFNHVILALERRDYYIYGELWSIRILQGSPSCFFTPTIPDYKVYGKIEKVSRCITDVPNPKVRQKLEDLEKIKDLEVFTKVASFKCPFRSQAGFSKPVITIEDKDKLFHAIALHSTLLTSLSEINQFVEGLNLYGLLNHLHQYPLKACHLFLHTRNQLTAEKMDDLFMPLFSPRESNKHTSGEAVSLNGSSYLEDVESGNITCNVVDFNTGQQSQMSHISCCIAVHHWEFFDTCNFYF